MKNLIITTDLYENSDKNVSMGFKLAKALDMPPLLFHVDTISPQINTVFHPDKIGPIYKDDADLGKEIESSSLKRARSQIKRAGLRAEDFKFENFEGSISKGIDHLKTHEEANTVVVGASQHGNMHRLFLNTFSEMTYFHLNKDVFVIKNDLKDISHITYLLPIDQFNQTDLDKVARLAKGANARVTLQCVAPIEFVGLDLEAFPNEPVGKELLRGEKMRIQNNAKELLEKAVTSLKLEGVESTYSLELVLNKTPGKTLERMVKQEKSDLVVLKPGHRSFDHISVGSTTLNILRHVPVNLYMLGHLK